MAIILVAAPPAAAQSQKKLAVPSTAEIARAEALVKEIFGEDLAAAKTPEQRGELASKMLQSAEGTDPADAARYVLLTKATELAAQAGNGRLIDSACDNLAENYEVDVFKLKGRAFSDATKVNLDVQASGDMSQQVLALAEQAAAEQRFELAVPLLKVAQIFSRKVKSKELIKQINVLTDRMAALQSDSQAAQKAAKLLVDKPDDPAANLAYGKFLALGKRDWDKALPLLVKSGNAPLKAAAEAELAKPATDIAQANLGDAWYTLAKGDKTLEGFMARAHYWYELSLPTLTGLAKTRVEKRLEEASAFAGSAAGQAGKMGPITAKLRLTISASTTTINAIEFAPNGRTLASGGFDNDIRLWDVTSGESIKTINVQSGIRSLVFIADGKTLISCSSEHMAQFWKIPAGELQQKVNDCLMVSATADRKTLAVYHPRAGTITIWDAASVQQRGTLEKVNRTGAPQISADGKVLAATGDDNVYVWNVSTGRLMHKLDGRVLRFVLSPDGRMLAVADYDGQVTIWNLTTGMVKHSLKADGNYVNGMDFSPDGDTLVTGGSGRVLRFWDPHTGKLRVDVPDKDGYFHLVAFSPNGKTICTGNDEYQLKLWDVEKLTATPSAGAR